jgi:hypothetical protein
MTNKINDEFDLDTPLGVAQSVNWLVGYLKHIKEGGVWLIPRSGSAFEIRHRDKVAVKVMQTLPDPSLDKVFRAAGWKVVDNT